MKALILSHSNIRRDPRLVRQIQWLREFGFKDIWTVGCGSIPSDVDRHFQVPVAPAISRYLGYVFTKKDRRFWLFYGRHLDKFPIDDFKQFDLVVVNELEYLGWGKLSELEALDIPIYLDIHEDHNSDVGRSFLESVAFRTYGLWEMEKCQEFVEKSAGRIRVTTVEESIASLYEVRLKMKVQVIYNAPDSNNLVPQPIATNKIRLVHHGMGTKGKGIEKTVIALRFTDLRFHLTLLLFASSFYEIKLRLIAFLFGVSKRLEIRRGVPLNVLAKELNDFDIAIMLFSPLTSGLLNALPNKFFESLHSKLAIICGPNPAMKKFVEDLGSGIALKSWRARELAKTLNSLSSEQIMSFKKASAVAAGNFSSLQSKKVFNEILLELNLEVPQT